MLYLNSKDIEKVINHEDVVEIIEKTMKIYEEGNFVQPDRITVNRNSETYLYMPCFTDNVKGTKILTLFDENAKKGVPTIQGLMLLNSNETGKIKCIMDGASITAFRTGAVGSCGIKHTTPENVSTLGIIGTGTQGFYQALYACKIRNIKKISVFDILPDKAKEFKERLQEALPNVTVQAMATCEEVIEASEVIITVTTSSKPVIPNNRELISGKHFIGIGSFKPTMQEYPQALYEILDEVYIDVEFAKEETGDLANPLKEGWIKDEQIHTLGSVLNQEIDVEKTTLYKSVGMALFDIYVGEYIYKRAQELNIGTTLD